mmetsp:Transcript_168119/g.539962  ORF Transcript_168119/g.539962 Transcript_168119/m.539962 type:complete len:358 (+) Transcript_168119:479-1552(+)
MLRRRGRRSRARPGAVPSDCGPHAEGPREAEPTRRTHACIQRLEAGGGGVHAWPGQAGEPFPVEPGLQPAPLGGLGLARGHVGQALQGRQDAGGPEDDFSLAYLRLGISPQSWRRGGSRPLDCHQVGWHCDARSRVSELAPGSGLARRGANTRHCQRSRPRAGGQTGFSPDERPRCQAAAATHRGEERSVAAGHWRREAHLPAARRGASRRRRCASVGPSGCSCPRACSGPARAAAQSPHRRLARHGLRAGPRHSRAGRCAGARAPAREPGGPLAPRPRRPAPEPTAGAAAGRARPAAGQRGVHDVGGHCALPSGGPRPSRARARGGRGPGGGHAAAPGRGRDAGAARARGGHRGLH